jgi:hypothetical protein
VRIATWNVNSVGARLPRLLPWLEEQAPDVVALQETKCADDAFPHAELRALGYEAAHAGDGRWNGVAVLSRVGLADVQLELEGHPEPRLAAAQCGPLHVTSAYVPNGRSLDDPHYAYKLRLVRLAPRPPRRVRPGAAARGHGRPQRRAARPSTSGTSALPRLDARDARPSGPPSRPCWTGGWSTSRPGRARATSRSPTGTTGPG